MGGFLGVRTLFPMVNPPPPERERRAGEGEGDGEGLGARATTRGSGAPPSEDRDGRRYVDRYPGDRLGGDDDKGRRVVAGDGDGVADANAAATTRSKEPSSDEGEDEPSRSRSRSRSRSLETRGGVGSTRSSSSESSKSLESDDGDGDGMPFAPTHGGREGLWGGVESMGVVAVLPGLVRGSRGGTRAGVGFRTVSGAATRGRRGERV